ncbi:hypothetical protein [Streptomyces acidicola]|uniref:hypothetical protein n=1 Tax=Streptomyces acidicola TaxID=2596892 RepID=UPI0034260C70
MRRLSGEKPVISRILRPSLRPSRARRGAALAALCALTLAACGTERAGDEDTKAGRDDRVGAGSPTASRAGGGDADSSDAEFLAFMELLTSLAKPCLKDVPVPEPPAEQEQEPEPDTAGPPTAALPEPSLPDEPPPAGEPRDPESARKEVELSPVEKCDARIHTRRITKALKDTADPTPGQVGDVLRGLGYIDERVHGPQRSGESVEFTLDLRVMGGQLCLSGSVTGARTVVEPYGASEEVGCLDVRRSE